MLAPPRQNWLRADGQVACEKTMDEGILGVACAIVSAFAPDLRERDDEGNWECAALILPERQTQSGKDGGAW